MTWRQRTLEEIHEGMASLADKSMNWKKSSQPAIPRTKKAFRRLKTKICGMRLQCCERYRASSHGFVCSSIITFDITMHNGTINPMGS